MIKNIKQKCAETTRHIANKILLLRRIHKLTQEEFAERVDLDRRTIARAEDGKHRASSETLEAIAEEFQLPISYFYDNTVCKTNISKSALIYKINARLNVLTKDKLNKVLKFLDLLD